MSHIIDVECPVNQAVKAILGRLRRHEWVETPVNDFQDLMYKIRVAFDPKADMSSGIIASRIGLRQYEKYEYSHRRGLNTVRIVRTV